MLWRDRALVMAILRHLAAVAHVRWRQCLMHVHVVISVLHTETSQ